MARKIRLRPDTREPVETEYARGFRDGVVALRQSINQYSVQSKEPTLEHLLETLNDDRFIRTMESAIFVKRQVVSQVNKLITGTKAKKYQS